MKRIAIGMLCMSIIFSMVFMGAFSVSAASYDETAYTLTGNQRADIAGIALTQVGYTESGNNVTKYGTWYGNNTSWCDIFVYWCAAKAGVSTDTIPHFGGCSAGIAWFQSQGLWQDASYTPQQGDLVFFDWGHVGIVDSVAADGSIYIIDGNFSDKVNYRRIYPGGGKWYGTEYITGYGTPQYAAAAQPDGEEGSEELDSGEPQDNAGAYYKVVTQTDPLNLRSSYSTSSSVVGSIPKDAVFHVSQTIASGGYTWGLTDYAGSDAWCALSYAELIANVSDIAVTGSVSEYDLTIGDTQTVDAAVTPDGVAAYGVSWSSSDETVAAVSSYGVITALNAGTAVVTATTTVGEVSRTWNVTVRDGLSGEEDAGYLGDVNGDGLVTVSDVVELRSLIISGAGPDAQTVSRADADEDGMVTVSDVVILRNMIMSQG